MKFLGLVVVAVILLFAAPARAAPTIANGVCTIPDVLDITADYRACLSYLETTANNLYGMVIRLPQGGHYLDPMQTMDPVRPGFNLCSTKRPVMIEGQLTTLVPTSPPAGTRFSVFVRADTPAECVVRDVKVDSIGRADTGFMAYKGPRHVDRLTVQNSAIANIVVLGTQGVHWGRIETSLKAPYIDMFSSYGVVIAKSNQLHLDSLSAYGFTADGVVVCGPGTNCVGYDTSELVGDGHTVIDHLATETHSHQARDESSYERQWFAGLRVYGANGLRVGYFYFEGDISALVLDGNAQHTEILSGRVVGPPNHWWARIDYGSHTLIRGVVTASGAYTRWNRTRVRPRNSTGAWVSLWNRVETEEYTWRPDPAYHRWGPTDYIDYTGSVLWTATREPRGLVASTAPTSYCLQNEEGPVWTATPSTGAMGWRWDGTTWASF